MLSPLSLDIDPVATSPSPIELDVIKTHCAVDFDDQDELLVSYMFAAIDAFEGIAHRSAFSREHRWTLKDFERDGNGGMWLPRGKVSAISSIAYVLNGTTTTLTGPTSSPVGDDYQEALFDASALILPPRGQSWPSVDYDAPQPVLITYTAGFFGNTTSSDTATFPATINGVFTMKAQNGTWAPVTAGTMTSVVVA